MMNWDSFYPPMFGSLLGVIGGFAANYLYQGHIADKNREKYKTMIKSEIKHCISLLEEDGVRLLPVDRWDSAVNSGSLKIFEADTELDPLGIVYQKIKDYNRFITVEQLNEAKWKGILRGLDMLDFETRMKFSRVVTDRYSLQTELVKLNNAKWLNPSNDPAPG